MHMISLVKSLKFLPFQTRFTSLSLHFLNINASKFYNDPSLRWHSSPSSSLYPTLSTPTSSSDQPSPPSQKKKSDLTMQEHYEFYLKTHHFESDLKQMNAISYFENLRTQLIQRRIQFDLDTQKKNKHTLGYLFVCVIYFLSLNKSVSFLKRISLHQACAFSYS
ncbi:hypothetical protein HMI55_001381 [Coelomomyces lativittatus]|nr:hypothetical protein HMI56_003800 [Coelomomyces lativittatus]KAJ1505960.1 hypothetical protein HMI55_001381 [Coelomomyces lativittatus]